VFTSDRSKWSKCIVVEASNAIYSNAGLPPEGNAPQFSLRKARSVTKDVDANGNPVLNSNPDSTGLSWFPGYAIDVETGMRLNIFFSENSSFDPAIFGGILEEVGENLILAGICYSIRGQIGLFHFLTISNLRIISSQVDNIIFM
jgi:hypothetical protein